MKKNVWILLDNRIGSRHQAEGIANYLDKNKFNIIEKEIEYNKFSALPNFIRGRTLIGTTKATKENLKATFPEIVIDLIVEVVVFVVLIVMVELVELVVIVNIVIVDFVVVLFIE